MMDEVTGGEKQIERYGSKSAISILAENSYKFIAECFSPFPPFTNSKIKSCKVNQNQSLKHFERCEYRIVCRPPIQLFKSYHDDKIKKNEQNPILPRKKLPKTNKMTNKIFQHNRTDYDSLKVYRDLYIYKSLGSVARKNLERAVAIYNANKDELELTRKFATKKNSNSCKRDQLQNKKLMKTETYLKTMKPKTDAKEKLTKNDLNQSLQGIISNEKNACKNIIKTDELELYNKKKDKNQPLNEIEISSKVRKKFIKKLVVKNDVKRILPKLPVRTIERKMKEKKLLPLAVLNISLPSLQQEETSHKLKKTTQTSGRTDYNYKKHTYSGLEVPDEIYCAFSNRERIMDDTRGVLSTPNSIKTSKKRSYLLKLPLTNAKNYGLNISKSENITFLTIQEPDKTFTLPSQINSSSSMLSQHITKERNFHNTDERLTFNYDQYKYRDKEKRRKKYPELLGAILKNSL